MTMADTRPNIPTPVNEPIRSYAPGTPANASPKRRPAPITGEDHAVPLVINGKATSGNGMLPIRAPHRHELVVGEHAVGGTKEIGAAINAALRARHDWAATPY